MILCVAPTPSVDRLFAVARLAPGEIHRPDHQVQVPGGKGLNAARAAAALGAQVRVVAPLGGHAGRWIAAELERAGVAADVVEVAGETRSCLTVVAPGGLTEFGEPLEHALRARPGLVKVNASEAARPAGAIRALTGGAAAVTHGADGLELCADDGRVLRARPPVLGAYPVGSGDACLAGMVCALAAGDGWAGALALGLGAAAANAEQPGAGRLDPQRARALAALV